MTRWYRANCGTIVNIDAFVPPNPCIMTTGGACGSPATQGRDLDVVPDVHTLDRVAHPAGIRSTE